MENVFIEFLAEYKLIFVFLHLAALALGVGGATISDILFLRVSRKGKVSDGDHEIFSLMSKVIWGGLLLAYISGFALFLPESERLLESSKFLLKVAVVLVITLNGAFLSFYIEPRMRDIPLKKTKNQRLISLRRMAFGAGAVSITSWYLAVVLGMLESIPYTFPEALAFYVALLIVAVGASQLMEWWEYRR